MTRGAEKLSGRRWDEPLIYELGSPGERSVFPPEPGSRSERLLGIRCPGVLRFCGGRTPPTCLNCLNPQVLRHYTRLSQMCLGVDVAVDMTGTCTMKYSPKVNELFARRPR
ncbi:MAG: hypothetical protein Ct9H300mP16_02110 [Pseudomonadota bacterium]|nr:MAG: hypothetical protein Ct9H300mP16_02110 [Pseudomonadota bacterium]